MEMHPSAFTDTSYDPMPDIHVTVMLFLPILPTDFKCVITSHNAKREKLSSFAILPAEPHMCTDTTGSEKSQCAATCQELEEKHKQMCRGFAFFCKQSYG